MTEFSCCQNFFFAGREFFSKIFIGARALDEKFVSMENFSRERWLKFIDAVLDYPWLSIRDRRDFSGEAGKMLKFIDARIRRENEKQKKKKEI